MAHGKTQYFRRKATSGKEWDAKHTCHFCSSQLKPGEAYGCRALRERALSYNHAMHAGTMYPIRKWVPVCQSCLTKTEKAELDKAIAANA